MAAAGVRWTKLAVGRLAGVLYSRSVDLSAILEEPRYGLSVVSLHAFLILESQVLSISIAIFSHASVACPNECDFSPGCLAKPGERGAEVDAFTVRERVVMVGGETPRDRRGVADYLPFI